MWNPKITRQMINQVDLPLHLVALEVYKQAIICGMSWTISLSEVKLFEITELLKKTWQRTCERNCLTDASGKRLVRLWASLVSFQRCKDAKDVKTSHLWKVGYLVSERHNTSFRDIEHLSKPCPGLSKDCLCTSFWFSVECLWYLWTVLFHKNNWYALQKHSYSSSDITM